jgi:myo-inositol 2-dehydrogenase/D-chiro-inositol 1-dehydrogenase
MTGGPGLPLLSAMTADGTGAAQRPALTIAVVGIGRMGRLHLEVLSALDDPGLHIACAEPSATARSWASSAGYDVYPSLEEALEDPAVGAVLIAAPTPLHVQLAQAALQGGRPVLCEKPGGFDPDALLALENLADRSGTVIRLGYWHRFVPALRVARARAMAGELGEVLAVHSSQWDSAPPAGDFLDSSGGELVDMGVHELDFAAWLLGESLAACGASMLVQPGGRNAAAGVARSQGGVIVTVSAGRFLPDGDGCWVEVLGTSDAIFDRWLWGDGGDDVNRAAVMEQDRRFVELARCGRTGSGPSDDLATVAEGARTLRTALQLTRLAGESASNQASLAEQRGSR